MEKKRTSDEIGNKLLQFIHACRENNCIVTCPIVQAMALRIAKDVAGQEGFKASNCWLESFRIRHHIVSRVLSGEQDLDTGRCRQGWCQNVQEVYHCTSDTCDGWDSVGHGSCQPIFAPRAFSSIKSDLKRLPPCISWSASKKGWMTSDIFHTFLVKVNENFRVSNRNCVLFLDNLRDTSSVLTAVLSTISPTPASSGSLQTVPPSVSRSTRALGKSSSCGIGSFYTNTCATKCSLTGLQQLAWTSCVCVCVWLSKAWNSLNGTQTVRRCFGEGRVHHAGRRADVDGENP